MSTAKPRYVGDADELIPDFSDELKAKLRGFYPDKKADTDPDFGHPADAFVESVLGDARWGKSQLYWLSFRCTKQEIRAEHSDLLKRLMALSHRLRHVSEDFGRLLGITADPVGCADKIDELLRHVEAADLAIKSMPRTRKLTELQHAVAVQMAARVLRALKRHGIQPAATGDSYFEYSSSAVQILKRIGDDIGLVRDELTWRDTIIKVKRTAPDLQ